MHCLKVTTPTNILSAFVTKPQQSNSLLYKLISKIFFIEVSYQTMGSSQHIDKS